MTYTKTAATCNNTSDGSLTIQNQSGSNSVIQLKNSANQIVASAQFSSPTYTFHHLLPGNYAIVYPDASVCGYMAEQVEITAQKIVSASIVASATRITMSESVTLRGPKGKGIINQWNLGDGTISTGELVTHQYSSEGVYTVVLTTYKGNCEETKSIDITVRSNASVNRDFVDVQQRNNDYYAVFNTDQNMVASIKVHNALGQLINAPISFEGKTGQVLLNLNDAPEGVYIVSINSGNDTVTRKIIK
jgi:PKD repeat protein